MGAGKTRLLRSFFLEGKDQLVYLQCPSTLHEILVELAVALLRRNHPILLRHVKGAREAERWLRQQTSCHLKGILWDSLEAAPWPVILDKLQPAGFQAYRFLQRLYHVPGMSFIAAARDVRSLGELHRLFWDPRQELKVRPLSKPDAFQLFKLAVEHFQLHDIDVETFAKQVIKSAKGNPGEILDMCQRATRKEYRSGRYVKFVPLRIDTLMRFHS
jgi:hypothetical protein